jgi:phosphoglycerate dehydrogenase-like enzyme
MGKKFKALLYESMHQAGTMLLEEKCEVIYARSYDEKDIINQVADVDAIIIRANGAVTEKIIGAWCIPLRPIRKVWPSTSSYWRSCWPKK